MISGRRAQPIDQFAGVRARFERLLQEIAAGLEALHRVQFEEPWRRETRGRIYGEW